MNLLEKLEKRYPVELANESDIPQILEVFNKVWSNCNDLIKRNQKLYCRRYLENPFSRGIKSIAVARDGDKIVGFTGSMDFKLSYHQKLLSATWVVDQAVLPDYQSRGIGYFLLKSHFEREVIAVSADNNDNAQLLHKSIGVRDISPCSILRRWSHPKDVFKVWRDKTVFFNKMTIIDSSFDDLWLRAKNHYKILGIRNQAILKWRYENFPTRDFIIYTLNDGGQLLGYIITTMEQLKHMPLKGIFVDFLFCSSREVISKFISTVLGHLARRGAILVDTIATHSSLVEIFMNLGFYPTEYNPHFSVYKNEMSQNRLDLWDGRNWYLTYGDSDFFFTR